MKKYASIFIFSISICALPLNLNCKKDNASCITCPPPQDGPDSTSHVINWQVDTIGTWQSYLFGVWGTDQNNVYAIGNIYNPDSTTQGTNIMHWDGVKWNSEKYWEGDISAIYGFSRNDVWVAGEKIVDPNNYPLFGHWDGEKWSSTILGFQGWLRGLWGTSSMNLFAVGGNGMILHFDGSTWSQMTSGTTVSLWDIWGGSENQIYASGYDESLGRGVLLFYNGTSWQTLYDNIYNAGDPTNTPRGETSTVWGYDTAHVFIYTNAGTFMGNRFGWMKANAPTDNTFMYKIRGSSKINLFMTGPYSLIIHWNGKSWYRYDELYQKSNGDLLYSASVFTNQVFIVGTSEKAQAIVYRGTIQN